MTQSSTASVLVSALLSFPFFVYAAGTEEILYYGMINAVCGDLILETLYTPVYACKHSYS